MFDKLFSWLFGNSKGVGWEQDKVTGDVSIPKKKKSDLAPWPFPVASDFDAPTEEAPKVTRKPKAKKATTTKKKAPAKTKAKAKAKTTKTKKTTTKKPSK